MYVGCHYSQLAISDSPSLKLIQEKSVGTYYADIFYFYNPVISPSTITWCNAQSNYIYSTTNSSLSSPKLSTGSSQPTIYWDFTDSTSYPIDYSFKIKTYFPNSLYWFSPVINLKIVCDSTVQISIQTSTSNPQYFGLNSASNF